MILNNKDSILKYNVRRYIVIIVIIALIGFFAFIDSINFINSDINKTIPIIILSFSYVGFIVFNYVMDFTYIYFKEEPLKLIIRFVSMRPFDNRRSSIEVSKENFVGYEVKKRFGGLKSGIIIIIKTEKGNAKYPPISLTALGKEKRKLFFKLLSDHSEL